jgi:hypothetical protein
MHSGWWSTAIPTSIAGNGNSALRNAVVLDKLCHGGYAKQSANFAPICAMVGLQSLNNANTMDPVCAGFDF